MPGTTSRGQRPQRVGIGPAIPLPMTGKACLSKLRPDNSFMPGAEPSRGVGVYQNKQPDVPEIATRVAPGPGTSNTGC
jgi:hypothetical protein